MDELWIKAPAVTTGGKAHFWTRLDGYGARWWIVWDRVERQWRVETTRSSDIAYFSTDKQA